MPRLADQVGDGCQERLVVEAALGQVEVGTGIEPLIRSSSRSLYETITTGIALSRASSLMCRTSWMPSIRGMSMSLTTRS